MSVESICGIVRRKKRTSSGFEPSSTCTVHTIGAATLTAWPTVERCGGFWGTYTSYNTPNFAKKKKRVFVLVIAAFFTHAKILPLF